jgi:hypothetical protein
MGRNYNDSNRKMLSHQSKNPKKKLQEKKVWSSLSMFQNLRLKFSLARVKKQKLKLRKMRTTASKIISLTEE